MTTTQAQPPSAEPSSPLTAALEAYETADFAGALAELEQAEDQTLSRTDLAELLAIRALVFSALQQRGELRTVLAQLAAIDATYDFGLQAPPDVQALFEEVRASRPSPLSLALHADARPGGVLVQAEARHAPAGLSLSFHTATRVDGGTWREASSPRTFVAAQAGARVDYYGELIGPGRAVLDAVGFPDAPESVLLPALAPTQVDAQVEDEGPSWVWLYVTLAAVVVAGGVTALVLLSGNSEPDTVVRLPEPG